MKLRIRNLAKLEAAELELKGITVIVGDNNTGKSTVGKIVFAMFNSLVDVEEKLNAQKEKLISQVLTRSVEGYVNVDKGGYSMRRLPYATVGRFAKELADESDEKEQESTIRNYLKICRADDGVFADIFQEVQKIKRMPEDRLIKSVVSAYFDQIFHSEINNVNKESEPAEIEAEIKGRMVRISFQNNICCEVKKQINILNGAVYIDNPFVLDLLNKGLYGSMDEVEHTILGKLRKRPENMIENAVQYSFVEEKLNDVLKKLNEVISGSLLLDDRRAYCYQDQRSGKRLNINNLSTGLKSFIMLKTLLENGALKEKDVLILDEPEIHLHPAWQLVYAEAIVLLQKAFDLTIVLTTHSSHFMESLQFFAHKYDQENKCSWYLSKDMPDGCTFEDMSGDLSKMYAQLVDPSILLDKMKYEMEEAEDDKI